MIEVKTALSTDEVAQRVREVAAFDRFSVFTFRLTSEQHAHEVATADGVTVTNEDGTYIGYVEDQDDNHYYVNLR